VASCVELGVSLRLLKNPQSPIKKLFTPLWEVTNVFLVFGFTGITVIFSGALNTINPRVLPVLSFGIVALLIRACLGLIIFYIKPAKNNTPVLATFAIANLIVPMSFAAAGVYFLTGWQFWQSGLGWVLMACAVLGSLSIGYLSTELKTETKSYFEQVLFVSWMIMLGSVLPIMQVLRQDIVASKIALLGLSAMGIAGISCAMLANLGTLRFRLWKVAGLIGLVAILLLAWSNRPYLVSGDILLVDAYSAKAYLGAFVIGTLIIFPLLALGFYLFFKLLTGKISR
jgi:cytochrome bd-type quinol oxidase subunit 2